MNFQKLPDMQQRLSMKSNTEKRLKALTVNFPQKNSAPDSKDLYADNIAYMDKLVGKLTEELDRLNLREKTLVVFGGDNGTANKYVDQSTIGGRRLSGQKGSMLECGALVPMIASWPGTVPAGKVSPALIDSTDFLPTFAELAGAKHRGNTVIDGVSFTSTLRGEQASPRQWIFIGLGNQWYARDAGWKLNRAGKLYDMSNAPFEEKPVAADTGNPAAVATGERSVYRRRGGPAAIQIVPDSRSLVVTF